MLVQGWFNWVDKVNPKHIGLVELTLAVSKVLIATVDVPVTGCASPMPGFRPLRCVLPCEVPSVGIVK